MRQEGKTTVWVKTLSLQSLLAAQECCSVGSGAGSRSPREHHLCLKASWSLRKQRQEDRRSQGTSS